MKIVFIGQERAGYDVLEMLLRCREDVVGVFTPPHSDKIADWVDFDPLMSLSVVGCHMYFVGGVNHPSTIEDIRALGPDLIIVVSWSEIIPTEILDIPPKGVIGIHYSLLPKRRGGAPIAWAIIDGLEESGITLFYYSEKVDAGDIIAQKKFDIRTKDDPSDLLKKINRLCVDIIWENLPRIKDGTTPRFEQDENVATYTKKRTPMDSLMMEDFWHKPMQDISNFIRALDSPYPHAYTVFGNKRIEFYRPWPSGATVEMYCHCRIREVEDDE